MSGQVSTWGAEDLERLGAATFVDVGHAADAAVDAAYREKYGRHGGLVDRMVSPEVQAATIRLLPAGADPADMRRSRKRRTRCR